MGERGSASPPRNGEGDHAQHGGGAAGAVRRASPGDPSDPLRGPPPRAGEEKGGSILNATGEAIGRARRLRREMSLPERMLWVRLRGRKGDERWRKQHPYGRLDLDFLNPASRLVIEVDGIAHDMGDRPRRDLRRDAWLRSEGFTIERIAALDILRDADAIADGVHRMAAAIRAARGPSVALRAPPPPAGEDGR